MVRQLGQMLVVGLLMMVLTLALGLDQVGLVLAGLLVLVAMGLVLELMLAGLRMGLALGLDQVGLLGLVLAALALTLEQLGLAGLALAWVALLGPVRKWQEQLAWRKKAFTKIRIPSFSSRSFKLEGLGSLLPRALRDYILGDLDEEFERLCLEDEKTAIRWYRSQIIRSVFYLRVWNPLLTRWKKLSGSIGSTASGK